MKFGNWRVFSFKWTLVVKRKPFFSSSVYRYDNKSRTYFVYGKFSFFEGSMRVVDNWLFSPVHTQKNIMILQDIIKFFLLSKIYILLLLLVLLVCIIVCLRREITREKGHHTTRLDNRIIISLSLIHFCFFYPLSLYLKHKNFSLPFLCWYWHSCYCFCWSSTCRVRKRERKVFNIKYLKSSLSLFYSFIGQWRR